MPALEFKWDRIHDANIDQGWNTLALLRGASVKNLDRTVPQNTLLKVLEDAGMPAMGEPYDSEHSTLVVTGRSVFGESNDVALIKIKYEIRLADYSFFPTETWYVRDDTSVTNEETKKANNNTLLECLYKPPSGASTLKDYPSLSEFVPMRTLVLQTTLNGQRPSGSVLDSVGTVNDAPWMGYPKGYWLCTGVGAEASGSQPTEIKVSATFLSRVRRDWKSYALFYDETGRNPKDLVPQDLADGLALPYSTTVTRYNGTKYNGMLIVGLYGMTNFTTVFLDA